MSLLGDLSDLSLEDLVERIHCDRPEMIADFEVSHSQAWESVIFENDLDCPAELLDDLRQDLLSLLSV